MKDVDSTQEGGSFHDEKGAILGSIGAINGWLQTRLKAQPKKLLDSNGGNNEDKVYCGLTVGFPLFSSPGEVGKATFVHVCTTVSGGELVAAAFEP